MRAATAALLLVGAATQSFAETNALKVYRGPNGQRVVIGLDDPTAKGSAALLRIAASDGPFDGLVLSATVVSTGAAKSFQVTYAGEAWVIARLANGRLDATWPKTEAFVASYSDEDTQAAQAAATNLSAEHARQRQEGRIAAFARRAWTHMEAKYERSASDAVAALTKACGVSVQWRYTWWTFDDTSMAEISAWELCQPFVAALQNKCEQLRATPKLSCELGSELGVRRDAGELRFTTTRNVPRSGAVTELLKRGAK